MEISAREKEEIKEHIFPRFEHSDSILNTIYKSLVEKIEVEITIYTGYELNDYGKEKIKQLITKYGSREVIESTFIALEQYYNPDEGEDSFKKAFDYIGRICFTRSKNKYGGMYGSVNYIVKIAKNNLSYVNEKLLKNILFKYMTIDNMEKIRSIVVDSINWTNLKQKLCFELNIDLEKF